jgi:glycosyltransferase involved in cell wall biosynthesis
MISAIVLTKNEAHNLERCLKSLDWCDEVIVIDDNSTDNTVDVAKRHSAKIIRHQLIDFASQRNFGLEQAKNDWVLYVDTDEIVTDALRDEIVSAIKHDLIAGYALQRMDSMWGRQLRYGETGDIRLLRLAKKGAGEWVGKVHEKWEIKGEIATLREPLKHYPHPTISEFISEINTYSSLRAEELQEQGIKAGAFTIIFYPKAKFFANYFVKLGFLDGMPGLVSALLMSLHSFLVRGKLWLLWQQKSG